MSAVRQPRAASQASSARNESLAAAPYTVLSDLPVHARCEPPAEPLNMRLLDVSTFLDPELSDALAFRVFPREDIPKYAIASHRWGEDEVTFQGVIDGQCTSRTGYKKVQAFAKYVRSLQVPDLRWLWIDTCCINKDSSTELDEAINSMHRWYKHAEVCLAYIQDAPTGSNISGFRSSVWFERAWTLQELLAPAVVIFVDQEWQIIGHKGKTGYGRTGVALDTGPLLDDQIAAITGIPIAVLQDYEASANFAAKEKLKWLGDREATLEEDLSYCMLGILGVSMNIRYGQEEGWTRERLMRKVRVRERQNFPADETSSVSACRNALFLNDPSIDRYNLISTKGDRTLGTCEWIQDNDHYQSWLRGEMPVLWLNGGPGKGKTMLSIFLTQVLEQDAHDLDDTAVIYFFCTSSDEKRNNAAAIVRTLIWQLLGLRPFLAKHLTDSLDSAERSQALLTSPEALWNLLDKLLGDPDRGTLHCVIDGLDECDEDSQHWFARKLTSLSTSLISEPDQHALKCILVSRPTLGLRNLPQIRLDPDNDNYVSHDIERFVHSRVTELTSAIGFSDDFRRNVEDTLLKRSNGTFLWVGFAANELLKVKTLVEVEHTLRSLPEGLPAIYRRMLLQIPPEHIEICALILRWVTMAIDRLTPATLAEVVRLHTEKRASTEQNIEEWVSLCGQLLVVEQRKVPDLESMLAGPPEMKWSEHRFVRLVHESARDYLLRTSDDSDTIPKAFRIGHESANDEIAEACLDYIINCQSPEHKLLQQKLDLRLWSQTNSFLRYALFRWPNHARPVKQYSDRLSKRLASLFEPSTDVMKDWWRWYTYSNHDVDHSEPQLVHVACFLGLVPLFESAVKNQRWKPRATVLNLRDSSGRTPLIYALLGHQDEFVQFLLEQGADVNRKDKMGVAALYYAVKQENVAAIRILVGFGAEVNARATKSGDHPLHVAANSGEGGLQVALTLLELGADINSRNDAGRTSLHMAAFSGQLNLIRTLVELGADVAMKTNKGNTSLHIATFQRKLDVVRILVALGADVAAKNEKGRTPLHLMTSWYASSETPQMTEIVKILLKSGADIEARDKYGYTPLYLSASRSCEDFLRALIESGADVNAAEKHGRTPLDAACDPKVALILDEFGAFSNKADHPLWPSESIWSLKDLFRFMRDMLDEGAGL